MVSAMLSRNNQRPKKKAQVPPIMVPMKLIKTATWSGKMAPAKILIKGVGKSKIIAIDITAMSP